MTATAAIARAQTTTTFKTTKEHRKMKLETFGTDPTLPLLILLHGSDGPGGQFFHDQGRFFAASGYQVLYPHYYDAAPTLEQTDASFEDWIDAVRDLVQSVRAAPGASARKVYLLGFSQGSEIALGAGAEGVPVQAIAEWYGALFANYAKGLTTLPPLLILHGARDQTIPVQYAQQLIAVCEARHLRCESHIYPAQGHGFGGADLDDADQRSLQFFSMWGSGAK